MNVQFKQNLQRQFLDHQNDRLLSREKYIFNKPFIFILSLKTFSELFLEKVFRGEPSVGFNCAEDHIVVNWTAVHSEASKEARPTQLYNKTDSANFNLSSGQPFPLESRLLPSQT